MKIRISLTQSHIRARIVGFVLILIGIIFLLNPTPVNSKIGFVSIFTGIFMVYIITDKSFPEKMGDAQVDLNLDTVKKILKDFNLNGNAVFLPKSNTLNEERILIPPNQKGTIKIPNVSNDTFFLTGKNGENLGLSIHHQV